MANASKGGKKQRKFGRGTRSPSGQTQRMRTERNKDARKRRALSIKKTKDANLAASGSVSGLKRPGKEASA